MSNISLSLVLSEETKKIIQQEVQDWAASIQYLKDQGKKLFVAYGFIAIEDDDMIITRNQEIIAQFIENLVAERSEMPLNMIYKRTR